MLRKLLLGFGVFEVIAPQPVIDICERIGLANPDQARLRPHARTVARLEGLVFVWLLLRGRKKSPFVTALLGTLGGVAAVYPRPLIRLSQDLAYENTSQLELQPWVVPAARALGIIYLLVIFLSEPGDDAAGDADSGTAVQRSSSGGDKAA